MTEKVYGFRGEDIFIFEKKGKEHILVERIGDETISGNLAFELVPVVSKKDFDKANKIKDFLIKKERADNQKTIKHLQDQISFWCDIEAKRKENVR